MTTKTKNRTALRADGTTVRVSIPTDDVGRDMEGLMEALNAIADWASDAGPLAGKGPMEIAEFARAAARKVS